MDSKEAFFPFSVSSLSGEQHFTDFPSMLNPKMGDESVSAELDRAASSKNKLQSLQGTPYMQTICPAIMIKLDRAAKVITIM